MWLKLDLEGIDFYLQITGYKNGNSKDMDLWCGVEITLESYNWLKFHISDAILESFDIDEIRNKVEDLLQDRILTEQEISFTEPDLTIILHPKKDLREDPKYSYVAPGHEIVDITADLRVYLWNGVLTDNYLSLCFDRNNLECLLTYLECITHKISKKSEAVQELIAKDIIRVY